RVACRRDGVAENMGYFGGSALFDGDLVAGGQGQVERGDRGGDEERHAVFLREYGDRVGADLVGHVAITGDAVGAYDHAADASRLHEVAGHIVGDQGGGDAVLLQLPNGEARALQKRAGLIGVDIDLLAALAGG